MPVLTPANSTTIAVPQAPAVKRVFATAGHVDHGKSALVRALTGRDPDRLTEEKARGLTIELGFAWTRLPGGTDIAFVDVPGHQRFLGTTLSGLGPSTAVVFVVAADQGWQQQSSEHLAAIRALGITDGLLVITRCDLADDTTCEEVRADATHRLATAGLAVPTCVVSARTGEGIPALRTALEELAARLPPPDPDQPVRLWCDRSFTIPGAGTVVTGTLGVGTLRVGDRLTLISGVRPQSPREVVIRGLHHQDLPQSTVGPVSRVAINLRRTDTDEVPKDAVLFSSDHFAVATVIDVALTQVSSPEDQTQATAPPHQVLLHVGTATHPVHVRPLGSAHARLTVPTALPWQVGDRAILREPASRRLWSLSVVDVDPLPLQRRGAARQRATELASSDSPADVRLRSRLAEHPSVVARLGPTAPTSGVRVGQWWVDQQAFATWGDRLRQEILTRQQSRPLVHGLSLPETVRLLDLPDHLRLPDDGGHLPPDVPPLGPDLVRHLAHAEGLELTDGRVHAPGAADLGPAEAGVATLEKRLRHSPFAAPERQDLIDLGLGTTELAAAARVGRLLRLADEVVLLPDAPARAMREIASLDQPFTLSQARQRLGTTRRVAVPLLELLDARGWTQRVDGQLRHVMR